MFRSAFCSCSASLSQPSLRLQHSFAFGQEVNGGKIASVSALLVEGDAAETITSLAKDKKGRCNRHQQSRFFCNIEGLFLGSVSHKVGHLAECNSITGT